MGYKRPHSLRILVTPLTKDTPLNEEEEAAAVIMDKDDPTCTLLRGCTIRMQVHTKSLTKDALQAPIHP